MFWVTLSSTVAEVPKGEQLLLMMDANDRTSARREGWVDDKVGAYGRDALNDNGRGLLAFSAENYLALVTTRYQVPGTFSRAPKRGTSYTFQTPNRGKRRYRLGFILTWLDDLYEMSLCVDLL